ncbi:MAG TPA: dihydrodipicolinate synthase family protein [bacterium]|nr:dihydrodipicolinate synthase family protein [bacterium]HQQ01282.1 dihydrodipicolinate synthase family protein [bacterium]
MTQTTFALKGILPALSTPFAPDGTVNISVLRRMVRYHLSVGCHGFFVCGTAGEGLLLSRDERRLVVETVMDEIAGQVPIIVHVGTVSTRESAALAKDAAELGASAVSSIPPVYYPVGLEGIIEHLKAISGASGLPTYYYHIPIISHVPLVLNDFMEIIDQVPGLVGFKFTFPDLHLLWCILDAAGPDSISILYGMDEQLLQGLISGAVGGIGSTYNYQSKTVVQLYEAFCRGDLDTAMQMQRKVNAVVRILRKYGGNLATEKEIMKMLGYEVGQPRGPIRPFPQDRTALIRKELEDIGFFNGRITE